MSTFFDLLLTIFIFAGISLSCLGWGMTISKLMNPRTCDVAIRFQEVWLGFCALLFLLQVAHYITPLSATPCLALYGLGILVLVSSCSAKQILSVCQEWSIVTGTLLLLFATWIALRTMRGAEDYDDGLYHLNAVRWINEFAIVPGLGNLHERLGFNYSFFTFAASLNFYPFFNHGRNLATSWLLITATAECLIHFQRFGCAFWSCRSADVRDCIPAVFLPYLVYFSFQIELSSLQVDYSACVARIILFIYFCRNLVATSKEDAADSCRFLIVFGASAASIKLSNVVFSASLFLIAGVCSMRRYQLFLSEIGRAAFFAVCIVATWTIWGIITSGYPFFPSTFGGLKTDWTVPPAIAINAERWICSWARDPGKNPNEVLGNWAWLEPWVKALWKDNRTPVLLPSAVFIVGIIWMAGLALFRRLRFGPLSLALLPVLIALGFWFIVAPMPRFALGLFWLLPPALMLPLIYIKTSARWQRAGSILLFLVMCLPGYMSLSPRSKLFSHLAKEFTFPSNGWEPVKAVAIVPKVTSEGLTIYVPRVPDQGWDSPLPGTPYFHANIKLRGRGIASGFKTLTILPGEQ